MFFGQILTPLRGMLFSSSYRRTIILPLQKIFPCGKG